MIRKLVPESYAKATLLTLIPWAIFGNDEDGIFAEKTSVPGFPAGNETFGQFIRWWTRNPFHNLFFHVLALPLWFSIPLLGKSDWPHFWPKGRVALSLNVLPLLAFRAGGWEGYIGFRPWKYPGGKRIAVFGAALRKH